MFLRSIRAHYNYMEEGPDTWFLKYPTCGHIERQSPINIITSDLIYNSSLKPFSFVNYNYNYTWSLSRPGEELSSKIFF